MPGTPALARCVKDVAAFLDSDFGRQPVHVPHADAGAFADLLDLDQADHIVATMALRTPSFRVVQGGRTLPRASYTRRGRIGSRPVDDLIDVGRVHALFAAGATVVLQSLHRYWPPVGAFCRDLESTLGHPAQANAYLTPPGASGLDVHADAHDVFALQTHGRKRWVVHPPAGAAWDLQLEAGDALYLPRGTRHAAQTVAAASLHLTIGVRTTTWADLVRTATVRAAGDPALAEPLPAGWHRDPGSLRGQLADHLAGAAAELGRTDPEDLLAAAADGFAAARVPALTSGLRDLLDLDRITADTRLRRRDGTVCRLRQDGDRVVVILGDRRLSLPAAAAPAMDLVAARDVVTAHDLTGRLDADSAVVLLRRLVREGLLTIARD